MMNQLDINPKIISAAKQARLNSFSSILHLSGPDVERQTHLPTRDVGILHKAISQKVLRSQFTTAKLLHDEEKQAETKLSTGCSILDEFLRGGIPTKGITEICGESACGKTQLCLQMALSVQLSPENKGLASGCVYICTEDVFPNKRLNQLVEEFGKKQKGMENHNFMDNIFIEHAAEIEDLNLCIFRKVPLLLSHKRIRLVIIDSIAALFRCEYNVNETSKRAKQLSRFAVQLHKLSTQYNTPIICVNQVTASMSPRTSMTARSVQPALGISWANHVTMRLMMARTNQTVTVRPNASSNAAQVCLRTIEVMFAPHIPAYFSYFYVSEVGLKASR